MMAQSYRDLEVYRLFHELGVEIHHLSLRLPKFELYETGSQIRRASKSISANIVEGFGRRLYKADFIRFLIYAQSSCDETKEWLDYIAECHPEFAQQSVALPQKSELAGEKLYRFIETVKTSHITK